ncbi:MAG: hypothetical protein AAGI38_18975 [Bacteroidota bacterium]
MNTHVIFRVSQLFLFVGLLITSTVFAQVPAGMNYQAVVRDGQQIIANQLMGVEFSIFQDSAEVYKETHIITSNEYGLINAVVGEGNSLVGQMDTLDWANGSFRLKVRVDAGNGFESLGEVPIVSVPFSRQSEWVSRIDNFELQALKDVDSLSPAQDQVLKWDGTKWTTGDGTVWEQSGSNIHYSTGRVGINTATPAVQLGVQGTVDVLDLSSGRLGTRIYGYGAANFYGDNGNRNVAITYPSSSLRNNGFVGVYNSSGSLRAHLQVNSAGAGGITLRGDNGQNNAVIGYLGSDGNHGIVSAMDDGGRTRASIYSNTSDIGVVQTYGSNNNSNAAFGYLTGYPNNGYVMARRSSGATEAGMYVNSSNRGVVFGDVKNFRMEHPTQPGKEIWYACIEGPEAAAYERGTARLENGRAVVTFSEHFQMVASTKDMTVMLTPLSGASEGLAVIRKSENGFEVVELRNGSGNYEFDWEVKVVRQGFEDYQVIRDESEAMPWDGK